MQLLIVAALTAAAGAVQNIAGFGAGIILMLVFPYFYGILGAPALNIAICTMMTIIMAIRYHRYLRLRDIAAPLPCFALASALVIPIAGKADLRLLGIAFGVFFILLALYFMFVQKNLKVSGNPIVGAVCGLISGALSGLFSIGAPTMALYFRAITKDRDHYFADLQTTMAVSNVISTSVRIQQGLYTPELVPPTVIGFFGILLGQYLGGKVRGRLDADSINRFIYLMVLLSGLNTLWKYLLG